ncbi:sulfatase-like hydrolase/transferase [Pontibacter sp. G13]|uniref:sulfatase-like hydrolase/transferase n=1 Tax=Pontibacter sp. G13 TaxID=3074898 RepID=UPI00288AC5B8|nr:sulfatase-like hydrolase/transferase [Pontibacter sp. G13]WNJ20282.1 sulfatase-like hydrolase/transferase [Pontibacter sp. G13]
MNQLLPRIRRGIVLPVLALMGYLGIPLLHQSPARAEHPYPKAQPPNILWIITDDERADALACYNRAKFGTSKSPLGFVMSPSLDALASEGTLFTSAYCNAPACAPSRASMHTGKYPHHSGIYGFERNHNQPDFYTPTVPEQMRAAGYENSLFGKPGYRINEYKNGVTWNDLGFYDHKIDYKIMKAAAGHTDFDSKKTKKGKIEYWHYPDGTVREVLIERNDGELTPEEQAALTQLEEDQDIVRAYSRNISTMILGGESSQPADNTLDANITKAFQNYLRHPNEIYQLPNGKETHGPDTRKPQFINLGYHFPHSPVLPPKSFRDRFKDKVYEIPDFSETELESLPPQMKTLYDKMKIHPMTEDEKQQIIRDYYAFCAFGDSLIGASIQAFKDYCEQQGQEYLIVMAAGDHGWHLGEQGISAKFGPYQHSNHTAIIVASSMKDAYPQGQVVDEFVEFVDFAPTFFTAAGLNVNKSKFKHLDGTPLQHMISGKVEPRDYVLGEINHVFGPRAFMRSKDFSFSMRVRSWNAKPKKSNMGKNIKWALNAPAEEVEMVLFDLRRDPLEQQNVADDPAYRELAEWFRNKLGNIVLGDGRIECDWSEENAYRVGDFAIGADDKQLDIPNSIIPVQ